MNLLKNITLAVTVCTALYSATNDAVIEYINHTLSLNPRITVGKIEIIERKSIKDLKNWDAVFVKIGLKINDKNVSTSQILFTNGRYVTNNLIDANNKINLSDTLIPSIPASAYSDDHKIGNGEHKIIVFSDPLCPFCKRIVPSVIDDTLNNKKILSLYYYHLPLSIHPASETLCKAMILLQKQRQIDKVKKFYSLKIDPKMTNEKEILKIVNNQIDVNLTIEQINQSWIKERLINDKKLAKYLIVEGTPTLIMNGKKIHDSKLYKQLILVAKNEKRYLQ